MPSTRSIYPYSSSGSSSDISNSGISAIDLPFVMPGPSVAELTLSNVSQFSGETVGEPVKLICYFIHFEWKHG